MYVLKQADSGCLLSAATAQEIGMITLKLQKIKTEAPVKNPPTSIIRNDPTVDEILKECSEVGKFIGLGILKCYSVKLNIYEKAIPLTQAKRRIPFHIHEEVKADVKELKQEGIIKPVPENSHAQWVSPIVAVSKKDDTVRLCVDMRMPSKAIKRVRYPILTVNDIIVELNSAKYFSDLDLTQAYCQFLLHK